MSLEKFNRSQMERFQRHFSLAGFGIEAQSRLLESRVVVVGAGGLGSPILTYLAAAGVGSIDVIDHDVVDRSNLHRQVIHSEASIGAPKTTSAAEVMRGLHPELTITEHREPITAQNALRLLEPGDLVVDGSDNFATRYVVADTCEIAGLPLISGSILRYAGQVSMFWSQPTDQHWPRGGRGPGYRDLYPEAPDPGEVPTCAEAGVLGVLPGVVGSLMAAEAVKFLAGVGESLLGRVLTYDALSARFRELTLNPDPSREPVTSIGADVEGLGGGPQECDLTQPQQHESTEAQDHQQAISTPQAATTEEATDDDAEDLDFNPFTGEPKTADDLTPRQLRQLLDNGSPAAIIDVREPHEWAEGEIPQAAKLPMLDLFRGEQVPGLDEADQEHPVVVYCAHGIRSQQAVRMLKERQPGLPVRNLLGGYELWRQYQS
ncbi:ThiF family adenylyltransferase [Nesterenkonia alba]|uniref:ThiF family adenylyltransferase n=1 Tax=Nesterenkonia alba TaxID=515814 RepID=UPI0003B64287|nr:ThiF family adenylyltransferase [Nesterenkonia alba]